MIPKKDVVPLTGLARRLVLDGLLAEEVAKRAQQDARGSNVTFLSYVIKNKILSAAAIAHASAHDFGLPLLDLASFETELAPINLIPLRLITQHRILPLAKRDNRLYIAVSDPTDAQAFDEIKFTTGLHIQSVVVEENKLSAIIEKMVETQEDNAFSSLEDTDLDSIEISADETQPEAEQSTEAEDAPIVRFVHKILLDAINKGASDIHFEPYEKNFRVRFRIDGLLYEIANPPVSIGGRLAARLKVMSKLDISERRVPQDGRFKMSLKHRSIDFRVSTCPTLFGEKVVLRILDPTSANLNIEQLGFEPKQKETFLNSIHKPQGMVLVTGPTGSGKTVTLYTALGLLNTPEANISTVEDPVEINLPGINQVPLNLRAGLTFSSALRAFLRQDPDIIMVGEIRDAETAEIAVKAAQTGHMVLSTLHTNSAPETLNRLINMGIAAFDIAASVELIIAQRLGRRLCPNCKQIEQIPKEALLKEGFLEEEIPDLTIYTAKTTGCEHCVAGYKGRVGLYEILPMTQAIGRIIMSGGNSMDIADQAIKEGMITLREAGLLKVKQGLTSLEEIHQVTVD